MLINCVYRRGSSLTIVRARASDSGEYWCQAVNVLGLDTSTSCTVTVEPPGKPVYTIRGVRRGDKGDVPLPEIPMLKNRFF